MIIFKGTKIPDLSAGSLKPSQVDAVEKVLGMSFPKIQRALELCVCGHGRKAHLTKDGDLGGCRLTDCDCDQHSPDVPTRLSFAFAWVAIREQFPDLTFDDLLDTPGDELEMEADDEADPTPPSGSPTA